MVVTPAVVRLLYRLSSTADDVTLSESLELSELPELLPVLSEDDVDDDDDDDDAEEDDIFRCSTDRDGTVAAVASFVSELSWLVFALTFCSELSTPVVGLTSVRPGEVLQLLFCCAAAVPGCW